MSLVTAPHSLGPIARIPLGEARVFHIEGRNVAVFRCRSGEVFATSADCPHGGGPLADGLVGSHSVICPLHGFVFDLRTGEAPGRECERLITHRVAVAANGELMLDLA
ncbi:MAG TPA: Rieske 2Fe-2S domain-containing protein [Vicinamibacterales bacterium]|nr:Rieske 2Fe-2S domain-containing protein [Vicinamibacterales bacterium]